MAADIFTKAFTDVVKWRHAQEHINNFRQEEAVEMYKFFAHLWTLPRRQVGEKKEDENVAPIAATVRHECPRMLTLEHPKTPKFFIEVFGGTGNLADAVRNCGIPSQVWDILDGREADLLNRGVRTFRRRHLI